MADFVRPLKWFCIRYCSYHVFTPYSSGACQHHTCTPSHSEYAYGFGSSLNCFVMQPFWHTYIYTVRMYVQSFNWYTIVRSITMILPNTYTSQKLLLCRLQRMFTSPSYYIMLPTQNAYTVGWARSALKGCRQFQTLRSLLSKLQQEAIFPHWQCELHCMQALLCVLCSLLTLWDLTTVYHLYIW